MLEMPTDSGVADANHLFFIESDPFCGMGLCGKAEAVLRDFMLPYRNPGVNHRPFLRL